MNNNNQTLQGLIEQLPEATRQEIMEATEIPVLMDMQKKHKKNQNTLAVIQARIDNLCYLTT